MKKLWKENGIFIRKNWNMLTIDFYEKNKKKKNENYF